MRLKYRVSEGCLVWVRPRELLWKLWLLYFLIERYHGLISPKYRDHWNYQEKMVFFVLYIWQVPDRHRWHLMLLLMVSSFLPVVKLLSGSMPCAFCRWDMLRSFEQGLKSKMMDQSRRDSHRFIMIFSSFFGGGAGGQIASFLIFQTDNSCGMWLQKQSLTLFNNHISGLSGVSRSSRPCLIQMALQIGHYFSLFGAITASDLFKDLIANWMLEVWSAFKFLFKVFHGSVGNQTSMEPPFFVYLGSTPPGPRMQSSPPGLYYIFRLPGISN